MKKITLKQVGYKFRGEATLNLWGGGLGVIQMDSWKGSNLDEDLIKGINDGQFGCESIDSAEVDIYEIYEQGFEKYVETRSITGEDLKKGKCGI